MQTVGNCYPLTIMYPLNEQETRKIYHMITCASLKEKTSDFVYSLTG